MSGCSLNNCASIGDRQWRWCRKPDWQLDVQVPYDLREDDTPDDWECQNNVWDEDHASCSVPQELTDKEIDNILALQVATALESACWLA